MFQMGNTHVIYYRNGIHIWYRKQRGVPKRAIWICNWGWCGKEYSQCSSNQNCYQCWYVMCEFHSAPSVGCVLSIAVEFLNWYIYLDTVCEQFVMRRVIYYTNAIFGNLLVVSWTLVQTYKYTVYVIDRWSITYIEFHSNIIICLCHCLTIYSCAYEVGKLH